MKRLCLCLLACAAIWAVVDESASGQILRLGSRRCSPAAQRFREATKARKQPVVVARGESGLGVKQAVSLLPDYTRCIVVCRQPALIDPKQLEELESFRRPQRELILSLDPDPATAFGDYLQMLGNSALVSRESNYVFRFFGKRKTRLMVSGMANYRLPRSGPAGATQSDWVGIFVFEQPCSAAWREFESQRPQQSKFELHREGQLEFFQDGELWYAHARPNVLIVGDAYPYFQDVVTNAARGHGNKQPAANRYVDLVDPDATFWFAYFADSKSTEASDWPVHVVEYVPNEQWTLTTWSGGPSTHARPKWDSATVVERFDRELIPEFNDGGRKSPPLVGHARRHQGGFVEMRFSVRDYDLETGVFPIFFVGLMGIAVFI